MPALAIASSQRNTLIISRMRLLYLIKLEEEKKREKGLARKTKVGRKHSPYQTNAKFDLDVYNK